MLVRYLKKQQQLMQVDQIQQTKILMNNKRNIEL